VGGHGPVATSAVAAVAAVVGSGNHLAEQYQHTLGDKRYELKNHLGNVLTVITDRKIAVDNVSYVSGNGTYISAPSNDQLYLHVTTGTFIQLSSPDLKVDYYTAEIVKSTEYSCYGVELAGWGYVSVDSYRYGFNGMECDDEIHDGRNSYDFGARIMDPRLARFFTPDPAEIEFPWQSTYMFAGNSPIQFIDEEGERPVRPRIFRFRDSFSLRVPIAAIPIVNWPLTGPGSAGLFGGPATSTGLNTFNWQNAAVVNYLSPPSNNRFTRRMTAPEIAQMITDVNNGIHTTSTLVYNIRGLSIGDQINITTLDVSGNTNIQVNNINSRRDIRRYSRIEVPIQGDNRVMRNRILVNSTIAVTSPNPNSNVRFTPERKTKIEISKGKVLSHRKRGLIKNRLK
jgi:RHS repeat-associated protein